MRIRIETIIKAPIERVWECWTNPEHIVNWNFATHEWCCPTAINDLQPGGEFSWRMEAKDGTAGFNFAGTYIHIKENELITYKMPDERGVEIRFSPSGDGVKLAETFDAEAIHSPEQQRTGWQAILDNFKKYVEAHE